MQCAMCEHSYRYIDRELIFAGINATINSLQVDYSSLTFCTFHITLFPGCYDHTVKIWDFRSSEYVLSFDHGAPVESVLMNQNGMICYSAGIMFCFISTD